MTLSKNKQYLIAGVGAVIVILLIAATSTYLDKTKVSQEVTQGVLARVKPMYNTTSLLNNSSVGLFVRQHQLPGALPTLNDAFTRFSKQSSVDTEVLAFIENFAGEKLRSSYALYQDKGISHRVLLMEGRFDTDKIQDELVKFKGAKTHLAKNELVLTYNIAKPEACSAENIYIAVSPTIIYASDDLALLLEAKQRGQSLSYERRLFHVDSVMAEAHTTVWLTNKSNILRAALGSISSLIPMDTTDAVVGFGQGNDKSEMLRLVFTKPTSVKMDENLKLIASEDDRYYVLFGQITPEIISALKNDSSHHQMAELPKPGFTPPPVPLEHKTYYRTNTPTYDSAEFTQLPVFSTSNKENTALYVRGPFALSVVGNRMDGNTAVVDFLVQSNSFSNIPARYPVGKITLKGLTDSAGTELMAGEVCDNHNNAFTPYPVSINLETNNQGNVYQVFSVRMQPSKVPDDIKRAEFDVAVSLPTHYQHIPLSVKSDITTETLSAKLVEKQINISHSSTTPIIDVLARDANGKLLRHLSMQKNITGATEKDSYQYSDNPTSATIIYGTKRFSEKYQFVIDKVRPSVLHRNRTPLTRLQPVVNLDELKTLIGDKTLNDNISIKFSPFTLEDKKYTRGHLMILAPATIEFLSQSLFPVSLKIGDDNAEIIPLSFVKSGEKDLIAKNWIQLENNDTAPIADKKMTAVFNIPVSLNRYVLPRLGLGTKLVTQDINAIITNVSTAGYTLSVTKGLSKIIQMRTVNDSNQLGQVDIKSINMTSDDSGTVVFTGDGTVGLNVIVAESLARWDFPVPNPLGQVAQIKPESTTLIDADSDKSIQSAAPPVTPAASTAVSPTTIK